MRLRFKPFLTAALLVLAVVSTPALSQDSGWFIGAGAGMANFRGACPSGGVPGFTCDDSGTAWKVFGGYQFGPHFGYEIGYNDFGEVDHSASAGGPAKWESKAYELVLVGTLPFSNGFSLYGKFGIFQWDVDSTPVAAGSATSSTSGREMTYAAGMKYDFTKHLGLRLEWQRYRDVGDAGSTGVSDVDLTTLGVVFKF